jgi:hypothetical protein
MPDFYQIFATIICPIVMFMVNWKYRPVYVWSFRTKEFVASVPGSP